jgi:uracil-DNA glycosylase
LQEFDPGYFAEPFKSLCENAPGAETYPSDSFRLEWGPIFHRGRLDGSAKVLIIGQDPATAETFTRRILVGTAGKRTQGLLANLGITKSYVLVNTFLYSVYGQQGGARHIGDAAIAAYRNLWLDALAAANNFEAVIALGALADKAFGQWPKGSAYSSCYQHITHPTEPESSAGNNPDLLKAATAALLQNWNSALTALRPKMTQADTAVPAYQYGTEWAASDLGSIPSIDLPAGIPAWTRGGDGWAERTGATNDVKRRTLTVTVPDGVIPPLGAQS